MAPAGCRRVWDPEWDREEEGVVVCSGGVVTFVWTGSCCVLDLGVGRGGIHGAGWMGGRRLYGFLCVAGVWLYHLAKSARVA